MSDFKWNIPYYVTTSRLEKELSQISKIHKRRIFCKLMPELLALKKIESAGSLGWALGAQK
jgi:hypothetical protein